MQVNRADLPQVTKRYLDAQPSGWPPAPSRHFAETLKSTSTEVPGPLRGLGCRQRRSRAAAKQPGALTPRTLDQVRCTLLTARPPRPPRTALEDEQKMRRPAKLLTWHESVRSVQAQRGEFGK
jgi:hypothetical protein